MKRLETMSAGGRNLMILGLVTILVAVATTSISLAIYHNSGDIYLDRSRPGFLPDETEAGEELKYDDYSFPKSGDLTTQDLDTYLTKLEAESAVIDAYEKPFDADVLSDDNLGILDEE